jgi:hypothetical protein
MILHLSHIFFTEGLTFIIRSLQLPGEVLPNVPLIFAARTGIRHFPDSTSIFTPQPQALFCQFT